MKIENLIKYWNKIQEGFQEDEKARAKHYKMVAEALENYEKKLSLDVISKVKADKYDEQTKVFYGDCQRCRFYVNSDWDFCPRCGHPLEFYTTVAKTKKSPLVKDIKVDKILTIKRSSKKK